MKTLIKFFFVLFILTFGCKGKDSVEVIPNYDEIYLPVSKIDSAPKLIDGNEIQLFNKIKDELKQLNIEGNVKLDYKLLVDENGNVNKVEVVQSPNENLTKIAVNQFANWKFRPGKKNNQNVKSQYSWYFNNAKSMNDINPNEFFIAVEQMPEPIGGIKAIMKNVVYPEAAKESGIQGMVYVRAYINEKGDVVGTEILKGVDSNLDEAAEAAVLKTKFTPAKQRGKNVEVQVVVPIVFKLN
jgi:TonB family protein